LNIDARRFRAQRRFAIGLFQAQEDKLLSWIAESSPVELLRTPSFNQNR
jgi:hypothetical protein